MGTKPTERMRWCLGGNWGLGDGTGVSVLTSMSLCSLELGSGSGM